MTMPESVSKDPVKRRKYLYELCGCQDDQTQLCLLDNEKCQGESCSIGEEIRKNNEAEPRTAKDGEQR